MSVTYWQLLAVSLLHTNATVVWRVQRTRTETNWFLFSLTTRNLGSISSMFMDQRCSNAGAISIELIGISLRRRKLSALDGDLIL